MKKIYSLILIILITACSDDGQMTYYLYKDGYGAAQFGSDHEYCMYESDWFPYNVRQSFLGPTSLNLRAKFDSNKGLWTYYEPFKGAQPVYVNYSRGDTTVDKEEYIDCMHSLGYKEKYAPYQNNSIGILKCNTLNCERNDFHNGLYREYQPR